MNLAQLQQYQANINMDVKVIFDQMTIKEFGGKRCKTIVITDVNSEKDGPTALLDLFEEDVEKFKFGDKMRLINCFAKELTTKRGKQMLISQGYNKTTKQFIGRYEKIQ